MRGPGAIYYRASWEGTSTQRFRTLLKWGGALASTSPSSQASRASGGRWAVGKLLQGAGAWACDERRLDRLPGDKETSGQSQRLSCLCFKRPDPRCMPRLAGPDAGRPIIWPACPPSGREISQRLRCAAPLAGRDAELVSCRLAWQSARLGVPYEYEAAQAYGALYYG